MTTFTQVKRPNALYYAHAEVSTAGAGASTSTLHPLWWNRLSTRVDHLPTAHNGSTVSGMREFDEDRVPLVAALPAEERARLRAATRVVRADVGELLFLEDAPGDGVLILIEGEVEILKAAGTPDEHLLAVRGPDDLLGEMSLLFPEQRRSATGRVRRPVTALHIGGEYFSSLLHRRPSVAIDMLREVVTRLRDSDNAIIRDLHARNQQLSHAYAQLRAAQAELVAQEKLAQELQTARQIQQSLLPETLPDIPGWLLAAHWEPARAVGGDFYDVLPFPDGRWGITIGDVTDKGVPAALMMATTHTVLHAAAADDSSPGAILARANDLLAADMPPRMFVTCQFLVLEPATGRVTMANAGHPLPLHATQGEVRELRATGMPLGLLPGMVYEEREFAIAPGEQVLLVSDGIIEAHAADGEMFGVPRLRRLVATLGPDAPLEAYCAAKTTFAGPEREQEDDVTLFRMVRLASPSGPG